MKVNDTMIDEILRDEKLQDYPIILVLNVLLVVFDKIEELNND